MRVRFQIVKDEFIVKNCNGVDVFIPKEHKEERYKVNELHDFYKYVNSNVGLCDDYTFKPLLFDEDNMLDKLHILLLNVVLNQKDSGVFFEYDTFKHCSLKEKVSKDTFTVTARDYALMLTIDNKAVTFNLKTEGKDVEIKSEHVSKVNMLVKYQHVIGNKSKTAFLAQAIRFCKAVAIDLDFMKK